MTVYAVVALDDLSIMTIYDTEQPTGTGGYYGDAYLHIQVPDNLDPACAKAVRNQDTDEVILVEDALKYAKKLERQWQTLREERNRRLATTDWTQSPDTPLATTQKEDYRLYRQALRDLPSNTIDPFAPEWPAHP